MNIQKEKGIYESILQMTQTRQELEAYSRKQSMAILRKEIESIGTPHYMPPYMVHKIRIQTNAFVSAHIQARRETGMSVN